MWRQGKQADGREPFELPAEHADRLVQLLAGAVLAVIQSGEIATLPEDQTLDDADDMAAATAGTAATEGTAANDGAPPCDPLFEGASACFTSSFVQADSLDFRQEEDS
jgi:hypothetical protein